MKLAICAPVTKPTLHGFGNPKSPFGQSETISSMTAEIGDITKV